MEQNPLSKKILLVDDDKFLLEMYSFKFKEKGFEVVQAFGSVDAVAKLKGGVKPDIIILDVVMPVMDGFELLALLKKENLVGDAKVVVLSNLGQPSDVEKGRALGANGYVIKASATPSDVVARVVTVLEGGESFAQVI